GEAAQWDARAFQVYYAAGALLTAPLLGVGSLLLAGVRRAGAAGLAYAGLAVGVALAAPVHGAFATHGLPPAQDHLPFLPARLLAILANSLGTLAVVAVASRASAPAVRPSASPSARRSSTRASCRLARARRCDRRRRRLLADRPVGARRADDELVRAGGLRGGVPVVGVRRLRRRAADGAVDDELDLLHRAADVGEPVLQPRHGLSVGDRGRDDLRRLHLAVRDRHGDRRADDAAVARTAREGDGVRPVLHATRVPLECVRR